MLWGAWIEVAAERIAPAPLLLVLDVRENLLEPSDAA
jgi:hypothetical protein